MSRMTRSLMTAVLVLLMSSLLAACGSVPLAASTQAPGTQAFSLTDQLNGTLSVSAPTGTFSKSDSTDGLLILGSDNTALSVEDGKVFSAGQWALSLGALPTNIAQAVAPSGQTVTPQIMLDAIKTQMSAAVSQVSFGTTTPTTIGGHNAARVSGTSPQGDVLLLALDLGNSYLLVTGVTATGELASREAQLTQIVSSATYTMK